MKHQRLSEQVEEVLSEEIAEGHYSPGDPLPPERELMDRFGVGRPSIREALFSLARRGLVDVGSGRRPRVREPSFDIVLHEIDLIARQVLSNPENIFHLMELRRILESAVARKVALEASDEQIELLRAKLDDNEKAIGHLKRFWKTDSDFHKTIAQISGNPVLPTIVDSILNWLIDNRRVTLSLPDSDKNAFADHMAIYQAIFRRDPDGAERAMNEHLISVEQRVREHLSSTEEQL